VLLVAAVADEPAQLAAVVRRPATELGTEPVAVVPPGGECITELELVNGQVFGPGPPHGSAERVEGVGSTTITVAGSRTWRPVSMAPRSRSRVVAGMAASDSSCFAALAASAQPRTRCPEASQAWRAAARA